jgi:hypothetical protein
MIDGLAALWGARGCTISASSVPWLELDGLAHRLSSPLAPRYAWRNFSIEQTVPRASL